MVGVPNCSDSCKHQVCIPLFIDIDECAEGTDRCAQNCHNNIGSYTCSCNAGYRLNANGYDCDGMI